MELSGKLIEDLQLDLAELNTYIQDSKRTNIKLQLEVLKTTLTKQIGDEKNKLERVKQVKEPSITKVSDLIYVPITKYAFDNNKDVIK